MQPQVCHSLRIHGRSCQERALLRVALQVLYAQISPVIPIIIPALRKGNWAWKPPSVTQLVYSGARAGAQTVQLRDPHSGPHTPLHLGRPREESGVCITISGVLPPLDEECGSAEDPPARGRLREQRQNVSSCTRAPSPPVRPAFWPSDAALLPSAAQPRASPGIACWPLCLLGPSSSLEGHPVAPTLPLVLSPQRQILTSGGPRIRLQDQDAGPAGSSSQDLFQGLSRQKNCLEEKEGPRSRPGGAPCSEAGCSMATSQRAPSCACSPSPHEHLCGPPAPAWPTAASVV